MLTTVLLNKKMCMRKNEYLFFKLHDSKRTEYITTGLHFTYLIYNVNLVLLTINLYVNFSYCMGIDTAGKDASFLLKLLFFSYAKGLWVG